MQRGLITPPVPRLLGMPLAAAFLGVSPRTFEKLWRSHQLPQPYRLGRRLLWDIRSLGQYVDALASNTDQAVADEDW